MLSAEADTARAHELAARRAVSEATRLLAEAREHKRLVNLHRRRTRERYQQLDEVIRSARARGIRITINAKTQEGPSVRIGTPSAP